MLRKLLTEKNETEQNGLVENIYRSLKDLQQKLEEEIVSKQKTIEGSWDEIRRLRLQLGEKDQIIQRLEARIAECQRNIDGNRQLINKLLNDLERMQQNIDWYKRTYESRSLMGVIKDRVKFFIVHK